MNILSELSNFLKYGLIGLGGIVAILTFYLLRAEQNRTRRRPSMLKGIYVFMMLGLSLVVIGLFAGDRKVTSNNQSSSVTFKKSSGNVLDVLQGGDDSASSTSEVEFELSDTNKVVINQGKISDSVKKKK